MSHIDTNAASRRYDKGFLLGACLIISFLYGFHHLLLLHDLDWDYRHAIFITSFKPYDADHYLSQIREIYDGNYVLSNAYIAEYKHAKRPLWPVLPLYLTGGIGKILHIEVQYLAVLMDFTLPPLIFLLTYRLLLIIGGVRKAAYIGALTLVLMPHLSRVDLLVGVGASIVHAVKSLNLAEIIPSLWHVHAYHNGFSRPINPQLTAIFLLAALLFFFKGLKTAQRKHFAAAAFFGVILSYSYIYFSTYLYAFWGIFAAMAWGTSNRRFARQTVVVLSVTILFAAPFWVSTFAFSDAELTQATLLERIHAPILTPQVWFMLALCGVIGICWRKRMISRFTGITTLSLLLSAVGCLNQRVVTGLEVQSWHYEIHVLPQATILAIALLAAEYLKTPHKRRLFTPITMRSLLLCSGMIALLLSAFASAAFVSAHLSSDGVLSQASQNLLQIARSGAAIIGVSAIIIALTWRRQFALRTVALGDLFAAFAMLLLVLSVAVVQYRLYYGYIKADLGYIQQLAPSLRWLNAHTENESVVLCGLNYTSPHTVIPIYTHNNLYTAPLMECYPTPSFAEIRDRIYNTLFIMGITSPEDFSRYYSNKRLGGSFKEYEKKLKKNLYTELKAYRVDYLFYGPLEQKSFRVDPGKSYPFLQEVYRDGIVTIYQMR